MELLEKRQLLATEILENIAEALSDDNGDLKEALVYAMDRPVGFYAEAIGYVAQHCTAPILNAMSSVDALLQMDPSAFEWSSDKAYNAIQGAAVGAVMVPVYLTGALVGVSTVGFGHMGATLAKIVDEMADGEKNGWVRGAALSIFLISPVVGAAFGIYQAMEAFETTFQGSGRDHIPLLVFSLLGAGLGAAAGIKNSQTVAEI